MADNVKYDIMTGEPLAAAPANEPAAPLNYANPFKRLLAFLLDSIAAGIITGILTSALRLIPAMNQPLIFTHTGIDILKYLIAAAYFVVFTGLLGGTPAKLLFRMRVVAPDGSKPSWFCVVYRETIGRFLNSILLVGYIVGMFDRQRRTFGDMLADTRVISKQ